MAYALYENTAEKWRMNQAKWVDDAPTIDNARRRAYNWMRAGKLETGNIITIVRIPYSLYDKNSIVGHVEYMANGQFLYFDNKKKKWHTFNLNTGELKK